MCIPILYIEEVIELVEEKQKRPCYILAPSLLFIQYSREPYFCGHTWSQVVTFLLILLTIASGTYTIKLDGRQFRVRLLDIPI